MLWFSDREDEAYEVEEENNEHFLKIMVIGEIGKFHQPCQTQQYYREISFTSTVSCYFIFIFINLW